MVIRPYVGEEALRELVRQIKTRTASVYTVKGSIGYATYSGQYTYYPYGGLPYYIHNSPSGAYTYANVIQYGGAHATLQEGYVFNLATDYTISGSGESPFIDKERGEIIKAGTNICIVNVGTAEQPVYKYDCLASSVDLTAYQTKLLDPANTTDYGAGNIIDALVTEIRPGVDYNTDPSNYLPAPTSAYYKGQIILVSQANSQGARRSTYYVFISTSQGFARLYSTDALTYPATPDLLTIENLLEYISACMEYYKQNKKLSHALTILTPDFMYATVAIMPTTGATAEGIETGDIAYVVETAKLYQATVDGSDNITWAEIGDQTTVEGAIKLLGSLAPNRPVTAAEVQTLFNA